MPTTITHSLASYTDGDYLDELSVDGDTEVSERRGTNGQFKKVKDLNPTSEFSIKGGGNPALAVGVSALTITGLAGGVKMLKKYRHTEHNNDFDDFEASGKHYPNASAA